MFQAGVSPTHVHPLLTQLIVCACNAHTDAKSQGHPYEVNPEQTLASSDEYQLQWSLVDLAEGMPAERFLSDVVNKASSMTAQVLLCVCQ